MHRKITLIFCNSLILFTSVCVSCQKEELSTKKEVPDTNDQDSLEALILFEQPMVTDLNNFVSKDPNKEIYQLGDQMLMTSYTLHRYTAENYSFPITSWDIGIFTGVESSLPFQLSQLSISAADSRKGSTAFQAAGNAVGVINAPHLFPEILNQIPGTLIFPVHPLQFTYSNNRRVRPFADNRSSLNMSFEIKMPIADGYETNGIGYLGPNFTIRDIVSGTIFYIGTQIWDSRGTGHEGLMVDDCDKCSGNVMVPTILSRESTYITPMVGSASFRGNSWNEFEYFGWSITRENFTNIIKEIKEKYPTKQLSDNLNNYEIVSFLMGTEVVLPSKEDKYAIAMALRNFKVTITR